LQLHENSAQLCNQSTRDAARVTEQTTPVIEIRDLHKSYGELEVLKGIDLVAPKGHVVSLIGSSGSGK
jgi:polar amino acid transport system ATP-binding protein